MFDDEELDDSSTTLVRSGKLALTFSEMAGFVNDIETRPAQKLLEDLPGLLDLPDAKHQLVVMVLRKKMRNEGPERAALLARLKELRTHDERSNVRTRVQAFLDKHGA